MFPGTLGLGFKGGWAGSLPLVGACGISAVSADLSALAHGFTLHSPTQHTLSVPWCVPAGARTPRIQAAFVEQPGNMALNHESQLAQFLSPL